MESRSVGVQREWWCFGWLSTSCCQRSRRCGGWSVDGGVLVGSINL